MNPNLRPQPFAALRLFDQHLEEAATEALIGQLSRIDGAIDGVWLSTAYAFPPLAEHARVAGALARTATRLRTAGLRVGLQVANTIGHSDFAMQDQRGLTWQRAVGPDGRVSASCSCPRAPEFLAYLRAALEPCFAWAPDSLWIDDDLRLGNHGAATTICFCPACRDAFAQTGHGRWEPASLAEAIARDPTLRGAWLAHGGEALAGVVRTIVGLYRRAAPDGLAAIQHGDNVFGWGGNAFFALGEGHALPLGSRPGGGFYSDDRPREMLNKAFQLGHQVARLPARVTQVCAEVESFPHTFTTKTPLGLATESALYLAVGCNTLSYAVNMIDHEPAEALAPLLARTAAAMPFLRRMVAGLSGTAPGGLAAYRSPHHHLRPLRPGETNHAWQVIEQQGLIGLLPQGLPLGWDTDRCPGVALVAATVDGCTDVELISLLAGGLLLDGAAALRIQERGFGADLGAAVVPLPWPDTIERITDDPVNGPHAGHRWRQYWSATGSFYTLDPASDTRVLGTYTDVLGSERGVATTLAVNARGGRIAILANNGYHPNPSSARRAQLLAVADWVAAGCLPVLVETPWAIVAVPRVDAAGRTCGVFLLNAAIDRSPPIRLRLRGLAGILSWLRPGEPDQELPVGADGLVEVPPLVAWDCGLLLADTSVP